MKYFTIYKITNTINDKEYIGCHITEKLDDGYMGSGKWLKRAIEKYGVENFKKDILFIFDNREDMLAKERELVNEEYVLREDTYNLTLGGGVGWFHIHTPEGRKQQKELSLERWDAPHFFASDYAKTTVRNTLEEKYGEGIVNVFQVEEVKEKSKESNMKAWGVPFASMSPEVKEKTARTNRERRGVDYPVQDKEVLDKIVKTTRVNHGVDYGVQTEKCRSINRERMKGNELTKGMKFITKDGVERMCREEELSSFIEQGWEATSHTKGTIWVNNGEKTKMITEEEKDDYLSDGWCLGRGSLKRKNLGKRRKMNKDGDVRVIPVEDVPTFLENGWSFGGVKTGASGEKVINNGLISKRVKIEDIPQYLADGWVVGRLPPSRKN